MAKKFKPKSPSKIYKKLKSSATEIIKEKLFSYNQKKTKTRRL